jgi:cytochrome c oxidase assembly protein subunit 15
MEKFKAAAAKQGIEPETITASSLRSEFSSRKAWTEYLNRLSATPVSILTLATFIAAFWQRERRPLVFWMAFAAVILLFANAIVGAMVVGMLLKPMVITIHLALAMGMLGTLVYCAWRGTDAPWRIELLPGKSPLRLAVGALLLLTVVEGILGSQIREITDELARTHLHQSRVEWIGELERSAIYLVHRSFSWAVFGTTLWAYAGTRKSRSGGPGRVEKVVLAIVLLQMVLGFVMARVHVYAFAQLLHVGLAAVLLSMVCLWWLGLGGNPASSPSLPLTGRAPGR